MYVNRLWTLLFKEIRQSYKNFVFIAVIIAPIILSLLVTLVFGEMFAGTPNLGILEADVSKMAEVMGRNMSVYRFAGEEELIKQVKAGRIDMGIILPPGFDTAAASGQPSEMSLYISASCSLNKRTAIFAGFANAVREVTGREYPLEIEPEFLGNIEAKPWFTRLMPLLVLLAIMMSGLLIPATTLASEKQNKTINALLMTPVSIYEVLNAKILFGFIISFTMGVLILFLNNALGTSIGMLLAVLALSAMTAATIGSLLGFKMKDALSAINLAKSLMLVFYAPAVLNMFPQVPEWIQKIFPTYYMFSPILKLSDGTFTLAADGWEVLVLAGVLVLLRVVLGVMVKKTRKDVLAIG